jgi:tetratricopeptide (TPR) repeat protein
MLPPLPMLAKKNRNYCGAIIFLTLAIFIAGCTPPGPRAFLKGKKYLERGDYAAAVEQFKTATTLLATNAQAWNYLGVACQRAGQPADAVAAYQRALNLDRDLSEAHFNLGCLWLEQNKPADAKTELTAYTLRRGNAPDGWMKLGVAQIRTSDLAGAEKSFSTAYYLNTNNPESLNGLGMVFAQRGRAREAAQYFASAIHRRPDYANAILNLATVAQQDLHDNKLALENYHAYLALTPRPANWEAVNNIVTSLEPPPAVAVVAPPPIPPANPAPVVTSAPPSAVIEPKTAVAVHTSSPPKPAPVIAHTITNPPPRVVPTPVPRPQVVKFNPEPVIVPPSQTVVVTAPPVVSTEPAPAKPGVLTRLNPIHWISPAQPETKYVDSGVTPLPSPGSPSPVLPVIIQPAPPPAPAPTPAPPAEVKPIHIVQPAAPSFPRYLYLSPQKPAAGNRGGAAGAFTQARELEQASRWPDAMQEYQLAAQIDPSWFEAQYNYGVLAYRLRNFNAALSAYEMALAVQPDSVDARYNFALALKAAGYAIDAVNELNKVIAASPKEVRAQLALGNLYAQQLNDTAQAREHYLKVLELDPHNPQANDIRFWLSANPS